jgi:glutamine synthetase
MAGAKPEERPKTRLNIGASVLPELPCDSTDRNRTSPFAFTGNKFEFRMPGSSCSIACPNMIMNTIVAEALCNFADNLEKSVDFNEDLNRLIHDTLIAHKRIIFNGNNYSEEWRREAKRRGLANFSNTVEAIPHYTDEKNVVMFEKHRVLIGAEIASRQEVLLESYSKSIMVECLTLIDLVRKDLLPAVLSYQNFLITERGQKTALGLSLSTQPEDELLSNISHLTANLYSNLKKLEEDTQKAKAISDTLKSALFSRETLFEDMASIREILDALESTVARKFWPFPTYAEILYSVK